MSEKKEEEPKFVEEKTIIYRGFKDAEEAKKFMDEMRSEMEKTWRSFDRIFEGTRHLLDTVFERREEASNSYFPYSVDDKIEYHRQRIKRLEEKKKLMAKEDRELKTNEL